MAALIDAAEHRTHNMYISQEWDIQLNPKAENLFPGFACLRLDWVQISSNNLMHYLALSQYYSAFSVMGCQGWMQSQRTDFTDQLMIL